MHVVCILLGISPASDCGLPTFRNPLSVPSSRDGCKVNLHPALEDGTGCKVTLHPALEDGTDRWFRNVGKPQSDAGEVPKRIHTRFKTRRKFEIKNTFIQFVSCIVTVWWTEVVQNYVRWYQWLYSGFTIIYSDYCFPLTKGNKKSVGSRSLFAGLQASSAVWLRSSLFFGCYTALIGIFRRFGNCQLTLRNVLEERRL